MIVKNEWWRGGIIYQVYPRSFVDTNGDGIGDLKGITKNLDYIASLGVDGVWISPFFTSPMMDFGYDVSDYQNIDPMFGTLADFDEMLSEMHKRGLKLIVDIVMNHSSDQHPWFKESRQNKTNPKADWYVWTDPKPDGTPINNWLSVFGGAAWRYDVKRGQYYFHQFLKEQPDLNVRNPEVQDELLKICKWWLDRGVDGFRLDALNHSMHDIQFRNNPPFEEFDKGAQAGRQNHPYFWQRHLYDKTQPEMMPFLKKLRKLTDQYPNSMMVAEVGDDLQIKTSVDYTDTPEKLHTAYSFALMTKEVYSVKGIRGVIEEYMAESQTSWPSWAFSNHDIVRTASRWAINGDVSDAQCKMLMALLTCLRGTAFIYQGDELGLTEADVPFEKLQDPFGKFLWPEDKGRDGCRTPFPWDASKKHAGFSDGADTWLPVEQAHVVKSVAQQEADENSILNFTRIFFNWRKNVDVLKVGDIEFFDAGESVLAFTRGVGAEKLVCMFNLYNKAVDVEGVYKPLEGHGLSCTVHNDRITLPAFGGFIGKNI